MKGLFEKLLGPKKDQAYYIQQGAAAMQREEYAEAERQYTKALQLAEEAKSYDEIAEASLQLAQIAEHSDKLAVAETHYRKAFQTREESEQYEEAAKCLTLLGQLYYKQHRPPDAEQMLQYAMTMYQSQLSPNHPGIADAASILGDCLLGTKSYAEAQKAIERAITITELHHGKQNTQLARELHKLAVCFDGQDKDADAQTTFTNSVSIYQANESQFDKRTAHDACSCYHDFARYYLKRGNQSQAKPWLQKAMSLADLYPGYLDEADLADHLSLS